MVLEIIQFIVYSLLIVLISKYVLVNLLRNIGESLQLSAKINGDIAGFATSIPELLTVSFSAFSGLIGAGFYNILSSNIINFLQYYVSLRMSHHQMYFKHQVVKIDLLLVSMTIFLPSVLLIFHYPFDVHLALLFVLLFILYYRISLRTSKMLVTEDTKEKPKVYGVKKVGMIIKYFIYLCLVGGILYFIGNLLSTVLENLAFYFHIPEILLGVALGFITSLPELITFFEAQKYYTKSEKDETLGVIEATNNLLFSNMLNLFVIQNIGVFIYTVIT